MKAHFEPKLLAKPVARKNADRTSSLSTTFHPTLQVTLLFAQNL